MLGVVPLADLLDSLENGILTWLPIVFFGALVWLLWRTLSLMPRVKPKVVEPTSKSSVTWKDVAGVDEAAAELQEVVDFLTDPRRFNELGARVPKGILLYGPPGTGKTLLAKAVAHASGASFYSQSASAFVEMFAGLGASRIRKLFETARKNQPAIVFIDELDAVGMRRSGHAFNREHDQTLNQLLVELDGFKDAGQVVVIGASNRLEDLDHALLRPGRFDRQVLVSTPRPLWAGGDSRGAHAREAARRGRRPRSRRPTDLRSHRRRPREHLQRRPRSSPAGAAGASASMCWCPRTSSPTSSGPVTGWSCSTEERCCETVRWRAWSRSTPSRSTSLEIPSRSRNDLGARGAIVSMEGSTLLVQMADGDPFDLVMEVLAARGDGMRSLGARSTSLEDLFLAGARSVEQ